MGTFGDPEDPRDPPEKTPKPPPPKKTHRAIWGAPYGLPELSAVWHLRDPIGTHWDTRRAVSAPWWLTAKLQVERSPPRPPLETFGDPKDPQDPPPKHHGAIWGAPYGLTELSAVWHLRDPIGTHWDIRRPVSAPWWLTAALQVDHSPPGPQ